MAKEEGFVRRWSRRKTEARAQDPPPAPVPEAAPDAAAAPAADPAPAAPPVEAGARDAPAEASELAALPDIDSLTYESDFTVFLRAGVPTELRNRALQRLWRSDPVLANLDGLLEYGEDFTKIGTVKQVVHTAYQVGRGMLDRLEDPPQPPTAADPGPPAALEPPAVEGAAAGAAEPPAIEAGAGDEAGADPEGERVNSV